MVAETVKSYPVNPYPALIPLSPSLAGLGGYNPGSTLLHPSYSPVHIMDQKAGQPQGPQGQGGQMAGQHGQDTPVGLGAPGLNLPGSMDLAGQLRKKDIFTQRKQREFIPDSKKDESYWDRRRRNNEAAKRSREKRRFNDMILETRVIELSKENHLLRAQLTAIKDKYNINGETLVNVDQVMSTMPQSDQILAINKRTKFSQALMTLGSSPSVTSLLSPEGEPASPTPSYSGHNDPGSPQHYSQYPSSSSHMDEHDNPGYDPPTPHHYAPSPTNYYGQSALNLTAHPSSSSSASHSPPSPSPSHMDYSPSDPELCRRSPEAGMSLPHKLRHKTHLGDKDAAAQSLLALHSIKSEPGDHHHDLAEDSVGSSDERDSGISYSSSSSCSEYHRSPDNNSSSPTMMERSHHHQQSPQQQQALNMTHYHHQQQQQQEQYNHHQQQQQHHQQQQQHQQQQEQHQQQQQQGDSDSGVEYENTHLRSELERLATEVATLKYMLVRRPTPQRDQDSDTSR